MLTKAHTTKRAKDAEMLLDALIAGAAIGPMKSGGKFIEQFRKQLKDIQ